MEFNLVKLAIHVRTGDAVCLARYLPGMGSVYASACRACVCRFPDRACDSCSRRDSCPWHLVFGQELASDPVELKRHQKPPLPFMFSFPGAESVKGTTEITCGLTVAGTAISYLDMLLEGLAGLLAAGSCPVPAEISAVGSCDYQGNVQPLGEINSVRQSRNLTVLSADGLLEAWTWGVSPLNIRLLSPLRLLDEGRLLDQFDFSRFARSLMRRVSSLAYYYGAYEYDCDFKSLSRLADAVICADDNFRLQSEPGRKQSGVIGYGRFQGDFSGLMPFLVLGSLVHVGKGASYGMGRYELSQENES